MTKKRKVGAELEDEKVTFAANIQASLATSTVWPSRRLLEEGEEPTPSDPHTAPLATKLEFDDTGTWIQPPAFAKLSDELAYVGEKKPDIGGTQGEMAL